MTEETRRLTLAVLRAVQLPIKSKIAPIRTREVQKGVKEDIVLALDQDPCLMEEDADLTLEIATIDHRDTLRIEDIMNEKEEAEIHILEIGEDIKIGKIAIGVDQREGEEEAFRKVILVPLRNKKPTTAEKIVVPSQNPTLVQKVNLVLLTEIEKMGKGEIGTENRPHIVPATAEV